MKIHLYYIGRPKDPHSNAIAQDFISRANHHVITEMREINPAKFDIPSRHPTAKKIYLHPTGKQLDSPKFAQLIDTAKNQAQDLIFLIGAHEGLTKTQIEQADLLLSLGPMTWPHELARALLAEQIYRAFAILKNLPYVR